MINSILKKIINNQQGIATLEMLIAMVLIILVITAVLPLVSGGQGTSIDSQTHQEALYKAQKSLEDARALARANFAALVSSGPTQDDIYTKDVTVMPDPKNPDSKLVTSKVIWGNAGQQVALSTLVTDPFSAAGICPATISSGWDHPKAYAYDSADDLMHQVNGNNSNGLGIADIKVLRQKMYLAANYTANDSNDFYLFDLPSSLEQTPTYLGRTGTVGRTNHYGLNSVTLGTSGNNLYAYVANAINFNFTSCIDPNLCPQFQVIDVTLNNPSVVSSGNLKMPVTGNGSCSAASNCMNGQGTGNVIYYYQGYVYLGLVKPASGAEFNIIDVGGGNQGYSPKNPHRVGGYTVGSTITGIYVKDNYAYLATDDNSGGFAHGNILVLDVTNKNIDPLPVASYYNTASLGYGRSISVSGNKIYLGRTYINSASPNYYIFNGSLPLSSPLQRLSFANTGSGDNIDAVAQRGNLSFLLINNSSSLSNSRFQVLDTSNSILPYGFISLQSIVAQIQGNGNNFSGSGAMTCSGDYFYTSLQTNSNNKDILAIITPGQ